MFDLILPPRPKKDNAPFWILGGGLFIRLLTGIFLHPFNRDDHFSVIRFILENGHVPVTGQLIQSYHPPLYYLLSVPFAAMGGAKAVQWFTVAVSILNLIFLSGLIWNSGFFARRQTKIHALVLASLLPQFVIFGSFVSNDALSFCLGTLIIAAVLHLWRHPNLRSMVLLAVLMGTGLSTKGTFLAFVPVILAFAIWIQMKQPEPPRTKIIHTVIFIFIVVALGGYKFVENLFMWNEFIVHSLDFPDWIDWQKGTITGIGSFVNINIFHLFAAPSENWPVIHSIPLLFYGTFWHNIINDSNFNSVQIVPFLWMVKNGIFLLALLPTLLIFWGGFRWVRHPGPNAIMSWAVLALGVSNFILVIAAGIRYDVWSCFQGRLLFPSLFVILTAYGMGMDGFYDKFSKFKRGLDSVLIGFYGLLGLYLSSEFAVNFLKWAK